MAQEPKPLGKPKAIRVPPGKENEYIEDSNGQPVHITYGTDEKMPGTVLPSSKPAAIGGGSRGFDVSGLDIVQNIITYDENGQHVVAHTTRREMLGSLSQAKTIDKPAEATSEAVERLGQQSEQFFTQLGLAAKGGAVVTKKAKVRTKKAGSRKRKAQRVLESEQSIIDEPAQEKTREEVQPAAKPVSVRFSGDFGKVTATYSGIFRDGICLVLYVDGRQLPTSYSLPESDEPMAITVEYEGHIVSCIHAAIQFTMPNAPVTFTVLLIEEEASIDEQGQPGQAGFDPM